MIINRTAPTEAALARFRQSQRLYLAKLEKWRKETAGLVRASGAKSAAKSSSQKEKAAHDTSEKSAVTKPQNTDADQ